IILPIDRLNSATKEMVGSLESEETFHVEIRTGDEIEELSESFAQMYLELREYLQELSVVTAEKERIGAELDIATQIQADMLPSIFPAFPEREEFDIFASMDPAKEVGGDFYDFFLIDEDHLALVIADVSGKGVPAALFMVIAKTLIKNQVMMGASPKSVLEAVNNQLCENNEAEMFVTVWLAVYEISTGKVTAANAGHEYPAIRRKGGSFELFKDPHGFVLAGMENTRYKEYEMELHAGDTLFVYTDGVPEATDAGQTLFGTERMLETLNKRKDADPKKLVEGLKDEIDRFVGEAMQFDDITMLSLRVADECK
ncbi:MAG: PP2C family protein-serine/threonine phosphatase, partial [Lachnospiraceae bacterium]|nr:PP2C family protein-serine/threonine phosphatase [Lachnospiraceae bacterium]